MPGPVLFYSKRVLQAIGGPDGRYGAADEWSFLYKVLNNGFGILGIDNVLVKYRVRKASLTHLDKQEKSPYYRECNRKFLKEVIIPDLWRNREYLLLWHGYIQYQVWGDKRKKLLNLLDPVWYANDGWYSLKSRIGKSP